MTAIIDEQASRADLARRVAQLARSLGGVWALGIALVLFAALTQGRSVGARNLTFIFNQSVITILCGLGMLFVMSQGSLDLSQGSLAALSPLVGYLAAQAVPGLMIPVTIATGAFLGLCTGTVFARFRVPSFILTLSASFILRNVVILIFGVIPNGLVLLPAYLFALDEPWIKLAVVIGLAIPVFWLFEFNKIGKWCKAIGADERVAEYSGVPVARMKVIVFLIAGIMGGVTGVFLAIRTGSVTMQSGNFLEFDVLIALLLGGVPLGGGPGSRVVGAFLGAITISVINNGLAIMNVTTVYQELVKGVILLVLVALTYEREKVLEIK